MIGKYMIEVLTKTGWTVVYEGDEAAKYMKVQFKAGLSGETTRTTCIGSNGARPAERN